MKVSTFQWTPEMETDPEAMEVAWNGWVNGLRVIGFQPSEQPLRWDDTSATYELLADSGLRVLSQRVVEPRLEMAVA